MKKIGWVLLIVGFVLMIGVQAWAATGDLNVICDDGSAKIYLDGRLVGTGYANIKGIRSGTHSIKADVGGKVIYNQIVEVKADQVNTIKIAAVLEQNKLNVHNFGVGYHFNFYNASGLSVKWFPADVGVQVIYGSYEGKVNTGSFFSPVIVNKKVDMYAGRLLFKMKDNPDSVFYGGVGIGKTISEPFQGSSNDQVPTDYYEVLFGFDYTSSLGIPELKGGFDFGYRWAKQTLSGQEATSSGIAFGVSLTYYVW